MSRDKAYAGPKLPQSLLGQFDGGASNSNGRNPRNGRNRIPASRKDKRKIVREEKRSKKHEHPHKRQKWESIEEDDSTGSEGADSSQPQPIKIKVANSDAKPKPILKHSKSIEPHKSRPARVDTPPSPPPVTKKTRERLDADDAEIAALEKKLGLKTKKLPKAFADDGLGELIDGLDESESDKEGPKRKRYQDDEWLERKRQKIAYTQDTPSQKDDQDELDDDVELDLADSDSDLSSGANSDGAEQDTASGDESDLEDFDEADSVAPVDSPQKRVRENPYVAPPTAGAQPSGKYIPPSRRALPSNDTELHQRLRRQTQGLLNRLSEANLVSIVNDVEKLFQTNPRQYVNATLVDLLLTLVCDRTTLNDTFIILHAGFIAAMYKVLGQDFGAQMLEGIVQKFDQFYSESTLASNTNKETVNLISLLAQLFNFQVISGDIIFDYIRLFLSKLTEPHTELLLRVVRTSGAQLRQDDPSSLKDIVMLLQKTVSGTPDDKLSVRTQFMIETINDLKNNRLKTGAAGSALASEHSSRMKKILGSFNSRGTVRATEPLRIPLADVRNADKRGKWWLVGASWKGADTNPPQANDPGSAEGIENGALDADPQNNLRALAQATGMNTPVRLSIFTTLLTATDARDAHTKLLKLRLSRTQREREVPLVILRCVGAERAYNPFYALVARMLCAEKGVGKALGFCLWGFVKRIGGADAAAGDDDDDYDGHGGAREETKMHTLVNQAKLFGALIADGSLGILVLKTMDVAALAIRTSSGGSKAATFLEVLLITILLRAASSSDKRDKRTVGSVDQNGDSAIQGGRKLDVESVFRPALELPILAIGLREFVLRVVTKSDLVSGKKEATKVGKGCEIVSRVLAAASELDTGRRTLAPDDVDTEDEEYDEGDEYD